MLSLLAWHGIPCWLQIVLGPFQLFLKSLFLMSDKPQALGLGRAPQLAQAWLSPALVRLCVQGLSVRAAHLFAFLLSLPHGKVPGVWLPEAVGCQCLQGGHRG